ncbi:hypothetical protein J6590_100060, partial [Homalodisca vitripennis]
VSGSSRIRQDQVVRPHIPYMGGEGGKTTIRAEGAVQDQVVHSPIHMREVKAERHSHSYRSCAGSSSLSTYHLCRN